MSSAMPKWARLYSTDCGVYVHKTSFSKPLSSFFVWISLQHMMVMEDMLKDFLLGEHLLLVGNQVSNTWKIVIITYYYLT